MKTMVTRKFRKIALLLSAIMILTMQSYVPAQAAVKTPAAPTVTVKQERAVCYSIWLTWKNLDKKYSYQVYRSSASSTKGYKCIGTVKASDYETGYFTDETPVLGKTNYYRVRAFFKSGGKTIYGKLSSPKKIKVVKLQPFPIKMTYKGKTVTLIKDTHYDYKVSPQIAPVLKTLGKPTKTVSFGKQKIYTYKAGKTSLEIRDNDVASGCVGTISIMIDDKNGALAGVKFGDSKAKAVSTLTKVYGKDAVHITADEIKCDTANYLPMHFGLKSGKVNHMSWWRS